MRREVKASVSCATLPISEVTPSCSLIGRIVLSLEEVGSQISSTEGSRSNPKLEGRLPNTLIQLKKRQRDQVLITE